MDDAHYWQHPAVAGVDLMRAHFVRHGFTRHSHATFALGTTWTGVEELRVGGAVHHVAPGGVVMLNPDEVHTGRSADGKGWAYRVFYPEAEVVAAVAGRDRPWFTESVVYDAAAAAVLRWAHHAAESGDRLASSTLLTGALSLLWDRYGGWRRAPERPDGRSVALAREILHGRLVGPPSLAELAAAVGASPFALVRAFRARHGLPPHAYVNQLRVRRACTLLAAGESAAGVAVAVGFTDQSHLTRHFRRMVGVTPARYARKNVQDRGGARP